MRLGHLYRQEGLAVPASRVQRFEQALESARAGPVENLENSPAITSSPRETAGRASSNSDLLGARNLVSFLSVWYICVPDGKEQFHAL